MKKIYFLMVMLLLSFIVIVVYPVDSYKSEKNVSPYASEIDVLLNKSKNGISPAEAAKLSGLIELNNIWFEEKNDDPIFLRIVLSIIPSKTLLLVLVILWFIGFWLYKRIL